ncbi:hypothetical protein [Sphingomonas sp. PvP056]|uniref:hypothetical protein n=1 Tax=Sphingomonas sp. PvP056 TaxID=3156392 RepID=UPI003394FAA6
MIAEDEDLEPDRTSTVRNYTFDEVVAGLSALGELDVARLDGISRGLARTADMEPKDLLHEAVHRMVTKRTCPVDVDIVSFTIQTMKSIASTSYRRRRQNLEEGVTSIPIAANDGGFDVADDAVSPEEQALARIFHGKCLELVDATVADDEELQLLVMGLCDGLLGRQLEELLETDTKGLAAARRRLANRLRRAFPDGAPV